MRIYPFFIPHGGCPHRCVFCDQERTSGERTAPSPATVETRLEEMLPERGEGEVAFYGGTFTLLDEALQRGYLAAASSFVRRGRVGGIRLSTRPDALCEESVSRLAAAGATTVEVGCQSFSDRVLAAAGRGYRAADARGAVRRLRSRGLRVGLQLMPGLPAGDRSEAEASLESALSLAPDFLRIYPTVVPRGSALERAWRAGRYRPLALDEAVEWCADLWKRCRQAKMPVIRMGLQGTPGLDGGDAWVAGPYHPAFGQLVRSRLWRRGMEHWLRSGGDRRIAVNRADLADALGHRRANHDFLQSRYGSVVIEAGPDIPRDHFRSGGRTLDMVALAGCEGSAS